MNKYLTALTMSLILAASLTGPIAGAAANASPDTKLVAPSQATERLLDVTTINALGYLQYYTGTSFTFVNSYGSKWSASIFGTKFYFSPVNVTERDPQKEPHFSREISYFEQIADESGKLQYVESTATVTAEGYFKTRDSVSKTLVTYDPFYFDGTTSVSIVK
ncbi:hypothetical protein ACFFK0_00295 [Paenibacillus chartarius]|uniref:Uncharacterized protein n=1 Tax=Paenibacillus chartarius TaxID=747481 RepID=A0ABV6DE38_9BACL